MLEVMSYDMNSTFTFKNRGIVYTYMEGNTSNPLAFGTFKVVKPEGENTGVLISSNFDKLTFSKPSLIEGNRILGENYEILLNPNRKTKIVNKKGDIELVYEKQQGKKPAFAPLTKTSLFKEIRSSHRF